MNLPELREAPRKERPILFSGPLVRAILEGRKRKLYPRPGERPDSPAHLARRLANGLRITASGCWEWQRAKNNSGYGTLTVGGRTRYAHRLAFELGVGPIPDGQDVMHQCDNPACINPEHLSTGTRSDNMRDCSTKGRARIPHPRMVGEANGAAKLSADRVRLIRRRLAEGHRHAALAIAFCVSQSTISQIARGETWAEVHP